MGQLAQAKKGEQGSDDSFPEGSGQARSLDHLADKVGQEQGAHDSAIETISQKAVTERSSDLEQPEAGADSPVAPDKQNALTKWLQKAFEAEAPKSTKKKQSG